MEQQPHILYISQYFPPEMGAPSARVFESSRRWRQCGADVTVLTGFPHHPTGIIPDNYKQHFYQIETIEGIRVIRTYVYPTANKGFFKRILSYLSFMLSAIVLGPWRTGKVDLVIGSSPQFFVAIAAYLISVIKRKPFVFEVRDLWPESIVQLGQLKNKTIIRVLEYIEVFLYRRAALIVVVAESSIAILREKGIPRDKIVIIKNGVDLNLFNPARINENIRERLQLQKKFIVSYIGTLGLSHALDKVLAAAELLKDNPDIHFLLIGEGAEKDNLIAQKEALGLGNVSFLGQIEKAELPQYYNLCDIILVTLRDLPLFQCVIPSKIFEIMAMGKPIIISVDGEARQLVVNEARAGEFTAPENPRELSEMILKLYGSGDHCRQLGQNGIRFVVENFDRDKLADAYLKFLKSVSGVR